MPERLVKVEPTTAGGPPRKVKLAGFREAVKKRLSERGWKIADLVRATKIDDAYLRRMMKGVGGARFNEEHISHIADVLHLPVYVGEVPRPIINVEPPPAPGTARIKDRPENIAIPVLPISTVIQKPFRYDPWKVKDWAYVNWRAFQLFNTDKMACVKLSMKTPDPLVRKEALICICTDTMPPATQVPPASVWAARKGNDLVIGHLEEENNVVLLVQKIPTENHEIIASREDILGRVCWVWHSMV